MLYTLYTHRASHGVSNCEMLVERWSRRREEGSGVSQKFAEKTWAKNVFVNMLKISIYADLCSLKLRCV